MPNTIPLASVLVLLGKHGYANGHSTRGVFELELGGVGQPRSAGVDKELRTRYSSELSSVSGSHL